MATIKCPDCSNEIDQDSRFCPLCGHQLVVLSKCRDCGKNLSPNARFCSRCGTATEQSASEVICEECGTDLAGLDLPEAGTGLRGRLLTDHIADLPTAPPVVVSPETTVAAAIEKMRAEKHGCVLVQSGNELAGIFTEKDVLTRVLRPGIDPGSTPVSEVMSSQPITMDPSDPPAFAIHIRVARDLRHIPVVEDSRIVGFLSVRHILRYIHEDILNDG